MICVRCGAQVDPGSPCCPQCGLPGNPNQVMPNNYQQNPYMAQAYQEAYAYNDPNVYFDNNMEPHPIDPNEPGLTRVYDRKGIQRKPVKTASIIGTHKKLFIFRMVLLGVISLLFLLRIILMYNALETVSYFSPFMYGIIFLWGVGIAGMIVGGITEIICSGLNAVLICAYFIWELLCAGISALLSMTNQFHSINVFPLNSAFLVFLFAVGIALGIMDLKNRKYYKQIKQQQH